MKRSGMLLLAIVSACGGGTPDDTAGAGGTTGATAGAMAGHDMAGMGNMPGMAMMDSMTVHMRAMDTASAASLQSMVPMHRQMAANIVSQMNTDMRGMNMQSDPRWTALMDSVRQDLSRLPDVPAEQLKTFMSAHHARLSRLMQSHRDMMTSMKR